MAAKTSARKSDENPATRVAPAVSDATDGGDSRLTKGYSDNPDAPDETSIAQVEELHEGEPGKG